MTQKQTLEILKLGYNVYLTGAAGTGKTHVLNTYIKHLQKKNIAVGITASTGIAATHMNGITIQSWSGIGIHDQLTPQIIHDLLQRHYLRHRYTHTKVLVIDEISMLHAHQLDMIDQLCRAFKGNTLPFGGLQIVMCGDFFQLPPVRREKIAPQLVTKSSVWNHMNLHICYLQEQFRQTDQEFLRVLNAIRGNRIQPDEIELLLKRYHQPLSSSIIPTKLYTHNIDVDAINTAELDKLPGNAQSYEMLGIGPSGLIETLKVSCLAPEHLILKKGAQVMFVKNNTEQGYVNGTRGKVVGFDRNSYPFVETLAKRRITAYPVNWSIIEDGKVKAEIRQVPLRLAWAITVHKSQGMTLDMAEIDLSKSFVPGMGYVALSRVKSLKGVKLLGLNRLALTVDPEVIKLDHELYERSKMAEESLKTMGWWKRFMQKRKFMYYLTS